MHLKEEVEPLKEHPVEAGEVEEVGEGEGCAEKGLGKVGRHQVLPREGEDPVECGETKSAEQPHVDLVTQAAHLPGKNLMWKDFWTSMCAAKCVSGIQEESN